MMQRAVINTLRTRARVTAARSTRTFASRASASASRLSPTLGLAAIVTVAGAGALYTKPAQASAVRPVRVDVDAVKKDIIAMIEADDAQRENGTSIAGTLVRLAWHTSGTYCRNAKNGGSGGATMRYEPESKWGANAGLGIARDALEPIKAKYPELTYSDLWTLAGSTAIEYMGGPIIKWRSGRLDSDKPTTVPDGRLPDADKGQISTTIQHVRDIFYRMGFNDQEIVALLGAHAIGRCHTDASGYWGPWSFAETSFGNQYYKMLLEETWTVKTMHEGKKWTGPLQFEDKTGKIMMLPSDMALIWDKNFRAIVEKYAKDEDLFFRDFANAWTRLIEFGVIFPGGETSPGIGIMAQMKKFLAMLGL